MALRPLQKLSTGEQAPDFTLPAAGKKFKGKTISLADYKGTKNVVLAFVPAAFTPVCTAQLPSLQDHIAEFERLNTQVLAICVDNLPSIEAWCAQMGGLSYPVLSDFWPHGFTALKYGILRAEGIAERSIFVIDRDGVIRYIDIHKITEEPPLAPVLELLQTLA
jgi:peroxiredoxin